MPKLTVHMLDKNCVAVLKAVGGTAIGKYKVYSYEDLLTASFLEKEGLSVLKQSLLELKKQGFVSIVYSDEDEVCLGVSTAGVGALQILKTEEEFLKKDKNHLFYAGILGGIIGSTIVTVTEIILKITGAV